MPFPLISVPEISYKLLDLMASVVYLGHIRRPHSLAGELELGMLVSKEGLPKTYPLFLPGTLTRTLTDRKSLPPNTGQSSFFRKQRKKKVSPSRATFLTSLMVLNYQV